MKRIQILILILLSSTIAFAQTIPAPPYTPMPAKAYNFKGFVIVDSALKANTILTTTPAVNDSSKKVATTEWIKQQGNVLYPAYSFQRSIDAGNLLDKDNEINGQNYNFKWFRNKWFNLNQKSENIGYDVENDFIQADSGTYLTYKKYDNINDVIVETNKINIGEKEIRMELNDSVKTSLLIKRDSITVSIDPLNSDSSHAIATTAFVKRNTGEAQGIANAAAIQQRIDSLRNNAGTLEARKGGVFVPQFVLPSGGGSTDTTSLSNRINLKLNIVDTANIRLRPIAGTNTTITGTYPNLTFNSTGGGGGSSGDTVTGRYAYINGGGIFGDTAILQRTDTIINFGASVESGSAGTGVGGINKWVSYLNKDLGTTEINRALGGSPFASIAGDDSAFINRLYLVPNYRKGIRYIIIGASNFINDVGLYGTGNINTYYSTVLRAIDTLTIARGYPLNRIIFLTPNTVGASNSASPPYNTNLTYANLKRVSDTVLLAAKSKGVVTIDVFNLTQKFITDGNIAQFLSADSVHPTLAGHKVITDIVSTFLGTLKVNNSIRVENSITVGKSADIKDYLLLGDNSALNPTSSILTANSTTKGILPPRMTTTQRNAIATPFNGLFIFNTTTAQYNYYDSIGSAWQNISTGAASGWGLTGNLGTNPATNFIGTTDNVNFNFRVNNEASGYINKTLSNTGFGYNSLLSIPTGDFNTAYGSSSLKSVTSGVQNVGIGGNALFSNTTGLRNSALGQGALVFNTTGGFNVAVGNGALVANTTASNNTALGYNALTNNNGLNNLGVGSTAGQGITSGNNNIAVGNATMQAATTGDFNTAVGSSSLGNVTSGTQNTGLGLNSLNTNTTGSNNTGVGRGLQNNTTGSNNIGIGWTSGFYNTTESNQLYISSLFFADLATSKTNSIIYGVQNATPSSQTLALNAQVSTPYTIKTGGYTVATLPAGTTGMMAYVTDALAPTYLGALMGGGTVTCPVFYNGTAWISH